VVSRKVQNKTKEKKQNNLIKYSIRWSAVQCYTFIIMFNLDFQYYI